jgi:hypothetical protein
MWAREEGPHVAVVLSPEGCTWILESRKNFGWLNIISENDSQSRPNFKRHKFEPFGIGTSVSFTGQQFRSWEVFPCVKVKSQLLYLFVWCSLPVAETSVLGAKILELAAWVLLGVQHLDRVADQPQRAAAVRLVVTRPLVVEQSLRVAAPQQLAVAWWLLAAAWRPVVAR